MYSKHAYKYIFPTVHPVSKSRISFSAQQVQKTMVGCFWLYVPIIPYGTRWKCTISAENPHKSAGSVHLYFQPRQSLNFNSFTQTVSAFLFFKKMKQHILFLKLFLKPFSSSSKFSMALGFFKVEFHKIYLVRPSIWYLAFPSFTTQFHFWCPLCGVL